MILGEESKMFSPRAVVVATLVVAALMQKGRNALKLTIPAGGLMNGIIYDYLRLELDEAH
jgi:hypothetical protein